MKSTVEKTGVNKGLTVSKKDVAAFFGRMVAFNQSLKLHHWHVTGVGSYAAHIALDQAIDSLRDTTDRIVETIYALAGDLEIIVPETKNPKNLIEHVAVFYDEVELNREYFTEALTQSILDDYQEAIQQLLYRLKRLQ